ncbi:MAG TPA: ribokinase [Acidimicrobiales bacterium]|nr:ribokinase [Acidimicrobiales bacterium]
MGSVVVAGSYNAGLTVYGDRLPTAGETILGRRFEAGPGGKGANQAIGIARLGGDVVFATKVGEDIFGAEARATLLAEGLPPHGILVGAGSTGVALILVDASGNNAISVAPGANAELAAADVLQSLGPELERADYIVCQLECPLDLALGLASWARAHGKQAVLNPAPAQSIHPESLGLFDVLTPNEGELAALANALGVEGGSVEVQARALVDCGVRTVVATLGDRGALRVSADGTRSFDAYAVNAVDTTGAGDAFTAGLVHALAAGKTMDYAVDEGCRAGAFCVTRRGVIDGLATAAELELAIPSRGAAPPDESRRTRTAG